VVQVHVAELPVLHCAETLNQRPCIASVDVVPLQRRDALFAERMAQDDVADVFTRRGAVQGARDADIIREVDIGDTRADRRIGEVARFRPIHDDGVQVDVEGAAQPGQVCLGHLGIPAVVEMDGERPQAEAFFAVVQAEGCVASTADADDAVILAAPARAFHLRGHFLQDAFAFRAAGIHALEFVVHMAIVADALRVEPETRHFLVHHTARTQSLFGHHCSCLSLRYARPAYRCAPQGLSAAHGPAGSTASVPRPSDR